MFLLIALALAISPRSSHRSFLVFACIALVLSGMKRLDNAHSGPAGPIEFAWCSMFEVDGEVAELDGLQSRVGMDDDLGRDCIRKAKIVRGSHAVY